MLQNYIGQRIYNSTAEDAGVIIGIDFYANEVCFVVDETTSPYYKYEGCSLGKFWQVSRLNDEIWIGNTIIDVIDPIIVNANKISNPIKQEAQLSLIQNSLETQKTNFIRSRFEYFIWNDIESIWFLQNDNILGMDIKSIEYQVLSRSATLEEEKPYGYFYKDLHGGRYWIRNMNKHKQPPSDMHMLH